MSWRVGGVCFSLESGCVEGVCHTVNVKGRVKWRVDVSRGSVVVECHTRSGRRLCDNRVECWG